MAFHLKPKWRSTWSLLLRVDELKGCSLPKRRHHSHVRSLGNTDLHDEDAHPSCPKNMLVVIKPRLDFLVTSLEKKNFNYFF